MPYRKTSSSISPRLRRFARLPGLGMCLVLSLFGAVVGYGLQIGGRYSEFVEKYGYLQDVIARNLGFGVEAVTIIGLKEVKQSEILEKAGISSHLSVLFMEGETIRQALLEIPMIQDVSVQKLYPDRILIEIKEREPYALWQNDGQIEVIALDGVAILPFEGTRFSQLPFVVGEGANEHIAEYVALLDAMKEMAAFVRAGIWMGHRRWNIKLASGIELKLPEDGALEALQSFVALAHQEALMEKDVLFFDLRQKGRLLVRLTQRAAAERAVALSTKTKKKGG